LSISQCNAKAFGIPIDVIDFCTVDPPLIIGGNQSANYPICLSYHLNSHYNSIIIPNGWFKLADPPGFVTISEHQIMLHFRHSHVSETAHFQDMGGHSAI
jgi:hypothetical protein